MYLTDLHTDRKGMEQAVWRKDGPEHSGAGGIFHNFGVIAVAIRTFVWAVLINDDLLVPNQSGLRMALCARDIRVAAG